MGSEFDFVSAVLQGCEPSLDKASISADVEGENTKLRALVEACGSGAARAKWLGKGGVEEGLTAQWLSLKAGELAASEPVADSSILDDVNKFLLGRSFLVSQARPALADVCMLWGLRLSVTAQDAVKRPDLFRWFLCMQDWKPVRIALGDKWPLVQANLNAPWDALNQCAGLPAEEKAAAVPAAGKKGAAPASVAAPASGKGNKNGGQAPQGNGEKKPKKEKGAKPAKAAAAAVPDQPDVTKLDIRVGMITKIWKHPDSETLFCEEIDVGEDAVRPIASGLAKFYDNPEDLTGRKVVVLCNLKPRSIGGYKSNGMVMCASNSDHTAVELVDPGQDAVVGERIGFEGIEGTFPPVTPAQEAKKKVFIGIAPNLKTDNNCTPMWIGPNGEKHKFKTSAGPCSVPTIADGQVS